MNAQERIFDDKYVSESKTITNFQFSLVLSIHINSVIYSWNFRDETIIFYLIIYQGPSKHHESVKNPATPNHIINFGSKTIVWQGLWVLQSFSYTTEINQTTTMGDNTSLTTIEVFSWQLKSRSTVIQATESFFMLFINSLSFFGNLLLGIAVIKNPNLRRTVPNVYIITLAVSDFLMSLLGIPFSVASLIVGKWPFNNFVCQLQGFWILLMCAVSLQTLAVTAVNRYFRVVRSRTQYQKYFNIKTTKVTIAILWILALFAPLPYVVSGHEFFFHTGKVFCAHNAESLYQGYGAYLVLVYVLIPLIIIITCYTKVFFAVRKHNLNFRLSQKRRQLNHRSDSLLSVDEVKVTYILLVVVIGFLTCWTPVMVIDMIDFINADWKLKRQVYVSYTCFGFASTSLNPIIYGIMNRSIRAEYLRILAPLRVWVSYGTASDVKADTATDEPANSTRRTLAGNKVGVSFERSEERLPPQDNGSHNQKPSLYRADSSTQPASSRGVHGISSIKFGPTYSLWRRNSRHGDNMKRELKDHRPTSQKHQSKRYDTWCKRLCCRSLLFM